MPRLYGGNTHRQRKPELILEHKSMKSVRIGEEVHRLFPGLTLGIIECSIENTPSSEMLWDEINTLKDRIKAEYTLESVNKRPAIAATRKAYKLFGKDPNRYRPSAEALCRRILRDLELYQVNTMVDLINLISIHTGYSIGGFDADKITGEEITLGIGRENEPFEAIGRGQLNISGLPVYRDEMGGIGTPTSDEERTKLSLDTTHLLMIINAYSGKEGLKDALDFSESLLKKYTNATDIQREII
jgi:DNA/RNA-binding domain of Phe-tRNA-synthetase-like protein